jgi:bifunctional UDP-N-acetylglucosamine pyrophosphorylase / glucosamine-1-phosphate N-acetyltransferase
VKSTGAQTSQPAAVIVLAAGAGTRMKSTKPKVLHEVLGLTLLDHVLAAASDLNSKKTLVIIGHGRDQVHEHLAKVHPTVVTAVQDEQNGTGHAVKIALDAIGELTGPVLVLAGDTPLLTTSDMQLTLDALAGKAASVLTAHLADATGYGRIVRNASDGFERIVEHRDASESELLITEVNSGVYAFDAKHLRESLTKLTTDNSQGEQYLTEVLGILRSEGHEVSAVTTSEENILGVNDRKQLADAGAILRNRINNEWMLAGVTMVDPNSVWIDRTAVLESDVTLLSNVTITGASTIRGGATVGPDCSLHDTVADHCATVIRTTSNGAVIGEGANVGPYTYLRPGTVLGAGARAGGFVEMKNANLGVNAKVPHLSYVGDATIGEGTNIGAATVFVNYDGQEKHHTQVGDHVRIGSDTMLVAPLVIGDGAYTAAGSVITEDVPAGSMAVGRARQRNILDWVLRRRPGSDSAKAALADSSHKNSK